MLELTGGFGADYTFEATGNVKVICQAVESARMGWGVCKMAGVAGEGLVLEVIPRYIDGQLDLVSFISHRMALDDVNDAFELMERQDGIRSVLRFS